MERIHVAMLTPYPPMRDGIAFYAEQFSEALRSIGGKVNILTWAKSSDFIADKERINITKIISPTKLGFRSSVLKALSNLSPDVVHVQYSFRRDLYGWPLGERLLPVLFTLQRGGIPVIMTIHDIWSMSDVFGMFGNNYINIPKAAVYYAYLRLVGKLIFRYVDAIIVHSCYFTELLYNEYNTGSKKVIAIEHGIPNYRNVERKKAKLMIGMKAENILLNFGVIWKEKKLERLIRAMKYVVKEMPDTHLVIAGPPDPTTGTRYVEELRRLAKRIGVEKYISIHAKFIDEYQIPLYFSASSLVVVPYSYSTGVSGVIRCSFAFERPVVANSGPLRIHEIGQEENARGLLVSPNNPKEFANAIITLLTDNVLYEKLRQNIRAFKLKNNWINVAKQTFEIYNKFA